MNLSRFCWKCSICQKSKKVKKRNWILHTIQFRLTIEKPPMEVVGRAVRSNPEISGISSRVREDSKSNYGLTHVVVNLLVGVHCQSATDFLAVCLCMGPILGSVHDGLHVTECPWHRIIACQEAKGLRVERKEICVTNRFTRFLVQTRFKNYWYQEGVWNFRCHILLNGFGSSKVRNRMK